MRIVRLAGLEATFDMLDSAFLRVWVEFWLGIQTGARTLLLRSWKRCCLWLDALATFGPLCPKSDSDLLVRHIFSARHPHPTQLIRRHTLAPLLASLPAHTRVFSAPRHSLLLDYRGRFCSIRPFHHQAVGARIHQARHRRLCSVRTDQHCFPLGSHHGLFIYLRPGRFG